MERAEADTEADLDEEALELRNELNEIWSAPGADVGRDEVLLNSEFRETGGAADVLLAPIPLSIVDESELMLAIGVEDERLVE